MSFSLEREMLLVGNLFLWEYGGQATDDQMTEILRAEYIQPGNLGLYLSQSGIVNFM